MLESKGNELLIVGSGPAGLTAAIYASRLGVYPTVLCGPEPGGQLTTTTRVENYPGYSAGVDGPMLVEEMIGQARTAGAILVPEIAVSVEIQAGNVCVITDEQKRYSARGLIVASGGRARWLGIPSEQRFRGFGVSACATCDGAFFKDQHVAVVGGGNTAVEEALHLSHIAAKVTLIHRRDTLRADRVLQKRLFSKNNIEAHWNSVVEEVTGEDDPFPRMTALRVRNLVTNQITELHTDGLFVAIGHDPATEFLRNQVALDSDGYIILAPWSTATSAENIWAAGDCADRRFRQAVLAAGMGCMAALEAVDWLRTRTPCSAEDKVSADSDAITQSAVMS